MKPVLIDETSTDPDMLPEYDFSKGQRGNYAERYAAGTNLVILSPDLVQYFPDSDSVNAGCHVHRGCEINQLEVDT